jgi:hypothetical protein
MVLDGLGLDKEATVASNAQNRSTYPQFEAWVSEHGTKVDTGSIASLNAAITGYQHDDDTRRSILGANGLSVGSPSDAVNLNNLDNSASSPRSTRPTSWRRHGSGGPPPSGWCGRSFRSCSSITATSMPRRCN